MQIHDTFVASEKFSELTKGVVELKRLQDYPLLMLELSTATRQAIVSFAHSQGIHLHPELELASLELMAELAKNGLGVACIPREFVGHELEQGTLKEIKTNPSLPSRAIGLALPKGENLTFNVSCNENYTYTITTPSGKVFDNVIPKTSEYGLHKVNVLSNSGKQAESLFFVRKSWEFYLKGASKEAYNKPQKASTHTESWYGYFSIFLAQKHYGNAKTLEKALLNFNEVMPLCFDYENAKPKFAVNRIQNVSAFISLLVDVYETDTFELCRPGVTRIDSAKVAAFNLHAVECYILEIDAFSALPPTGDHADSSTRIVDFKILENGIAYDTIPNSDTNRVAGRRKAAVRHADAFARTLRFQASRVCPERNAVVSGIDVAIRYLYILAAVDIHAVAVMRMDRFASRAHEKVLDRHALAAVDEARPVRRIYERDAFDTHILALDEVHHLAWTPRNLGLSAWPVLAVRTNNERAAVSVDAPITADCHVRLLDAENKMRTRGRLQFAGGILYANIRFVVVLPVGTALERGATVEEQLDVALEVDRAGKERPRADTHSAAACSICRIDSLLDCRRIFRHSVALRSIGLNIEIRNLLPIQSRSRFCNVVGNKRIHTPRTHLCCGVGILHEE